MPRSSGSPDKSEGFGGLWSSLGWRGLVLGELGSILFFATGTRTASGPRIEADAQLDLVAVAERGQALEGLGRRASKQPAPPGQEVLAGRRQGGPVCRRVEQQRAALALERQDCSLSAIWVMFRPPPRR